MSIVPGTPTITNSVVRTLTRIAHAFHFYPHDGKTIFCIKDGYLVDGGVIGKMCLSGGTPLKDIPNLQQLGLVVEAATALRTTPANVEGKLRSGESIMFRPRPKQERK